jgi:hypothetical protein
MVNWDTVRALALRLPEVEERSSYGTPGFRVRDKLFARLREDGELLVLRVGVLEREALIEEDPVTFLVTPHYESSEMVLVRLSAVQEEQLGDLLTRAWLFTAPKRLADAHGR